MANDEHRPVVLVVLNGWGYREAREGNAIRMAHVPTWDRLWSRAPRTLLDASGLAVGLPEGQMGNSEVGHLNLGAGRVVMQDIVRIDLADPRWLVLQDSGVQRRLRPRAQDGRHAAPDGPPRRRWCARRRSPSVRAVRPRRAGTRAARGAPRAPRRPRHAAEIGARVHGANDRARGRPRGGREPRRAVLRHGSRQALGAHEAVVRRGGARRRARRSTIRVAAIRAAYERGETDEFIKPMVVAENGEPVAPFRDGDALICFNYRSDRMRQMVRALTDDAFDGFPTSPPARSRSRR